MSATRHNDPESTRNAIIKAAEHELERDADEKIARKRVSLPLVPSDRPGTLQLDADHIAQVLQ